MGNKIFISFSFLDEEFAQALSEYFKKVIGEQNFELYCAALNNNTNAAKYGSDFAQDFIDNVNKCDVFIPLLSLNYKRSISSVVELGAAIGLNKTIAPLVLPGFTYTDFNDIYNLRNRDFYNIDVYDGIEKLLGLLSETIKFNESINPHIDDFINKINEIKSSYIARLSEVSCFSFKCDAFDSYSDYKNFMEKLKKKKMLECSVMVVHNNKVDICNIYLQKGHFLPEFKKLVETEKIGCHHIALID